MKNKYLFFGINGLWAILISSDNKEEFKNRNYEKLFIFDVNLSILDLQIKYSKEIIEFKDGNFDNLFNKLQNEFELIYSNKL